MGRSMWVEALAAAGALMGCNAVLKIVSTSSSRVPASNLTGTAGVGPGSALVPELADVLTDVNFLGNLFVLFTVSFTFFLWALRPPRCRRRSGRSGLGVRRTRASPGALSRASTAPSTAIEDQLFSFEDQLFSSEMSDGSSEMLRAGKGNIPVSNDSDLKHWDDVCVCVSSRRIVPQRAGRARRQGARFVRPLFPRWTTDDHHATLFERQKRSARFRLRFRQRAGGRAHEPRRPRRPRTPPSRGLKGVLSVRPSLD